MENSNDIQNIHQFDFSLICEYFAAISRQGPGSDEATLRALSLLHDLPDCVEVADVGCGTGSSALLLAQRLRGRVTAVDLFSQFLNILRQRAVEAGVADRVVCWQGSMEELPFAEASLDVIWCEGAIYNIGFQRGINEWRRLLKEGGYLVVSEAVWLTIRREEEVERFWQECYAEVDTVAAKESQLVAAGYNVVSSFVIDERCWVENFYLPQRQMQEDFLARYADSEVARELVKNQRHEAEMYARYKQCYGYAFFVAQKVATGSYEVSV